MAGLIAATVGGSALSGILAGAGTIGASLGTANIAADTERYLLKADQEFRQGLLNQSIKAHTDAGLPSYMAYNGQSGGNLQNPNLYARRAGNTGVINPGMAGPLSVLFSPEMANQGFGGTNTTASSMRGSTSGPMWNGSNWTNHSPSSSAWNTPRTSISSLSWDYGARRSTISSFNSQSSITPSRHSSNGSISFVPNGVKFTKPNSTFV
uniref:VP2 n=1 Tax=Wenling rattails calicivirus 2 TaxID=2116389 RepID=A0A2P1GMJ7_9CALI|nr:VP2 [Wenling rattails calicivirus 2]